MDQVRKASGNAGSLHSPPGESKFIDDHVAGFIDDHAVGADQPGGVADRRDCDCDGDRQAKQWRRQIPTAKDISDALFDQT
jgi:hypothetical protein